MAGRGPHSGRSRPWGPFLVVWVSAVGACLVAACASIEGLSEFASGGFTSIDGASTDDDAHSSEATTVPPTADANDDAADSEAEPEQDAGDEPPREDASSDDTGPRDSGAGATSDADLSDGRAVDSGGDAPICDSVSCGGCCTTSGLCASGGLSNACGTGGGSCEDCSSTGQACVEGACAAPPPDAGAGPPGCQPSTCANLCVPYFVQCCKSDNTCGCALLFPPGSCN